MRAMESTSDLVSRATVNATISWAVVGVLLADAVASVLYGHLIWAMFGLGVVAVAIVPPVAARDWRVTVAWQALALCALPMLAQTVDVFAQPIGHLALAALALVVVVELETFTDVAMPRWFAIVFVALTTIAAAGLWGVLQFYSDVVLGTEFLRGRADLMWDLVGASAVGVGAGIVFELYFRDRDFLAAVEDGVDV
jgi:hypothetical protein